MTDDLWLKHFHAGSRRVLADVYRDHYELVTHAVGRVLSGADQETIVHEVFCRLIADRAMRANFQGGSLAAWLRSVARNRAIDYLRRMRREQLVAPEVASDLAQESGIRDQERAEARMLIDRFRNERLPQKLAPVFEARFMGQLSQREAARKLGMRRTTLAYQEQQVRKLLQCFLLGKEAS